MHFPNFFLLSSGKQDKTTHSEPSDAKTDQMGKILFCVSLRTQTHGTKYIQKTSKCLKGMCECNKKGSDSVAKLHLNYHNELNYMYRAMA